MSWTLLTTLPVDGAEDAIRVVECYACRWMIEVLFRVLKTGCLVEKRQLETRERLERCLAVDLIVAWRILYLTMVGRETPNLPCSAVFEEYEWKALYVFVHKSRDAVPKEPPTLREVTRLIGRLGGHLGRKSDGHPGPMTLWRGLQRLPDISEMWQISLWSAMSGWVRGARRPDASVLLAHPQTVRYLFAPIAAGHRAEKPSRGRSTPGARTRN